MYSRQNPAYLAYIKQKEKQVQQQSRSLLWNFQWRVKQTRYNLRKIQRGQVERQRKQDNVSYLNRKRKQSINNLKKLNKRLQKYQQQVHWRNLERAKEEDDTLSSELANITTEEVKEIDGIRYIFFQEVYEKCQKYNQQLQELFAKQSYF